MDQFDIDLASDLQSNELPTLGHSWHPVGTMFANPYDQYGDGVILEHEESLATCRSWDGVP